MNVIGRFLLAMLLSFLFAYVIVGNDTVVNKEAVILAFFGLSLLFTFFGGRNE